MARDDRMEAHAIERARAGDAAAYGWLVASHLRKVVAIAYGVVRNAHDAEDLAQEAFVRAYQNLGRFRAGESFGPWVSRIVMNAALDTLKHRRKFPHEAVADVHAAGRRDDAELPAVSNEIARRIDRALGELPDMQRIVARLHLIEEMDHAEIAAIMDLSEGTVRSHLSLARKKLKEKLADLYGDGND